MNLVRARAVALRQFYLIKGSPVRILPMFGWVMLDVTVWGFISAISEYVFRQRP